MDNLVQTMQKFPLSVATGEAFCNRVEEIEKLKLCLLQKRPVLMMSPRRYGKTSLALTAIKKTKLPYANIDLLSIVDESDVEQLILAGVARLIGQVGNTAQKALNLANKIFSGSEIKVALTKIGLQVEFERQEQKPAYRILQVLERIDSLAEHVGKPVILFLDEFQAVSQVSSDHSIEAVLRQIAQLSKTIAFVFSGSNRHLLRQMFEDRNRPFYKMCEKMSLERISEQAYTKHINKVAEERWGKILSGDVIHSICHTSERHPYYMNVICSRMLLGEPPNSEAIAKLWAQYVKEEKSNVATEIELLSPNQRKLLTILARANGAEAVSGKEFVAKANMSKATITQAYNYLERKDYLYKDNEGHVYVLDPLIKAVLAD